MALFRLKSPGAFAIVSLSNLTNQLERFSQFFLLNLSVHADSASR